MRAPGSDASRSCADFAGLARAVEQVAWPVCRGRVTASSRLGQEAVLPGARPGDRVLVARRSAEPFLAEVMRCQGACVSLAPLGEAEGAGPGDAVIPAPGGTAIPCGQELIGRVIDPLGRPVDGGPAILGTTPWPLERPAPDPLTRRPVDRQLETGIRAVDGCLGLGVGQRVGLFAGPGLGKTTLLGALARRAACDACVVCLVGERGREVRDLLDSALGAVGLARSTVVLAPADAPPLLRFRALGAATAVAEWFRDQGKDVLLIVDSLTRVVRAARDVALSLGEPPARGGFPAWAFAALPALVERTGSSDRGSITAVYAVLTEGAGDDPVAEEARSLLDGHIVLSARLAAAGRFPAIDVVRSVSRVFHKIAPPGQIAAATEIRRLLTAYEEREDLVLMGAYRAGSCPDTDRALTLRPALDAFFAQDLARGVALAETRAALAALAG